MPAAFNDARPTIAVLISAKKYQTVGDLRLALARSYCDYQPIAG